MNSILPLVLFLSLYCIFINIARTYCILGMSRNIFPKTRKTIAKKCANDKCLVLYKLTVCYRSVDWSYCRGPTPTWEPRTRTTRRSFVLQLWRDSRTWCPCFWSSVPVWTPSQTVGCRLCVMLPVLDTRRS